MDKEWVVIILLSILLLYAILKWMIYKISTMAVLLYFAEHGQELPSIQTLQRYQKKIVKKIFHIEE